MKRKILGWVIISSLFTAFFTVCANSIGIVIATGIFGSVIAAMLLLIYACSLIITPMDKKNEK